VTADRAAILGLLQQRVANENLRRHMLATEAILRSVAARLGEDPDMWGLAGLAHDLDNEQTETDFAQHGRVAGDVLRELEFDESVCHAVTAHNPQTGAAASGALDVALIAADQLSGLITAAALVRPDRSLAGVPPKSVRKRYKETAFARGVDRDAIARCSELGLELEEFMAIGLEAMQGVAAELGLA
jgi:hypothetical protein